MNRAMVGMTALLVCAVIVSGCATAFPIGGAYTELRLPVAATSNGARSPKVGMASCQSYLGLFAIGDASIQTAKRNGGITKVHHVDWEAKNILGLIGDYKVIVYGE